MGRVASESSHHTRQAATIRMATIARRAWSRMGLAAGLRAAAAAAAGSSQSSKPFHKLLFRVAAVAAAPPPTPPPSPSPLPTRSSLAFARVATAATPMTWSAGGDNGVSGRARVPHPPRPYPTAGQGLTLVHFSAQLERFVWDRGCA
jgi:hypothetical protein